MRFNRRYSSVAPNGFLLVIAALLAVLYTLLTLGSEAQAETTLPATPTGLTAPTVAHDSVTLSWDDPGDSSITGYQVLRRDIVNQPPGTFATAQNDTGSAVTSYTDTSVSPETRYSYRIKARNASGLSGQSNYVNVETPDTPQPTVPSKPTGLAVSSTSHDGVTLTWDDPGDSTIESYQVLRRSPDQLSTETDLGPLPSS